VSLPRGLSTGYTSLGLVCGALPTTTSSFAGDRSRETDSGLFARDHTHVKAQFCGDLIEVLREGGPAPNITILLDALSTQAHYHPTFDEVYVVLDGSVSVHLYDPNDDMFAERLLGEH
jgi:hypothetical protein